jgi:hypothetical protein
MTQLDRNPVAADIVSSFLHARDIIKKNGGKREFKISEQATTDSDAPFDKSNHSSLKLTNTNYDMTQFGDSFIAMTVNFKAKLSKDYSTSSTHLNPLNKVFIGFKNSIEVFRQKQYYNRNRDVNYLQTDAIKEAFAYTNYFAKPTKNVKKYTHSLYHNVQTYDNSVCGRAINLSEFGDGTGTVDVEIKLIIPYWHFLELQCFEDYPTTLLGDLIFKYYVSEEGLVYTQIDPESIMEVNNIIEEINNPLGDPLLLANLKASTSQYEHEFTQVNCSRKLIKSIIAKDNTPAKVNIDTGTVSVACTVDTDTLTVSDFRVTECKAVVYSYNVLPQTIEQLRNEVFSPNNPFIIPSQEINVKILNTYPTAAGINHTSHFALRNVSDILCVFPRYQAQRTCYHNPMARLQLQIGTQLYPNEIIDSVGHKFFAQMLVASDMDTDKECTEEYEDSLTRPLNTDSGARIKNTRRDQTSFIATIQTERNGNGLLYDGLDTGNESVPVKIVATPIHSGANDTYYNVTADGTVHPCQPELWMCRSTFWTADSVNGLLYHSEGSPI